MSENPFAAFTPKKEWLVCVDSDGCAMDTMDCKHHQAFCPQLIRVYGLEEYAGLITPHWMEVNLYSRTRGVNRFKGLAATMRMLAEHGVRVPGADELCTWVEKAPAFKPGAGGSRCGRRRRGPAKALEWSRAVNAAIAAMGDDRGRFPAAERPGGDPCADGHRRCFQRQQRGFGGRMDAPRPCPAYGRCSGPDAGTKEACLSALSPRAMRRAMC
ncbi:MAG: hypothetical protein ACLRZH_08740 [Ruthenibacterium lactatiformans]